MSAFVPTKLSEPAPPPVAPTGSAGRGFHADLLAEAARAATLDEFFRGALERATDAFNSPFGLLYAGGPSSAIEHETHGEQTDPGYWRAAAQQFLTESLAEGCARARVLSARGATLQISLLAAPLFSPTGTVIGASVIVVRSDRAQALDRLSAFAGAMAFASRLAATIGTERATRGAGAPNQALTQAARVDSAEELAFSITNNLRNKLTCEQVALGLARGPHIQIASVSGLDEIRKASPGIAALRAAMEECLDHRQPIVAQDDANWDQTASTGHRMHRQWHSLARGAAVASLPLRVDERVVAVLSLRRSASEPFTAEKLEQIRGLVEPYAAALMLVQRASRSSITHLRDDLRAYAASLFQRGRAGRRVTLAVLLLFAAWFAFGVQDYAIMAPATLNPAAPRQLSAPFDGVLSEAIVAPGDIVNAGDVLCRLDARDLQLASDQFQAELSIAENQRLRALAEDNVVDARIAEANAKLARLRLEQTARRQALSVVRAPISGIVVSGDLRPQVGAVLRHGDPLLVVAPLDGWRLEIEAPEAAVDELQAGLTGWFASNARPEEFRRIEISRVRPAAETRRSGNVFVVEADIRIDPSWVKLGMEGKAHIEAGRRPVWWLWSHKLVDYLRLNYWL